MGLDFTGASTYRVNHGSATILDDMDPFTFYGWFYKSGAATTFHRLFSKWTTAIAGDSQCYIEGSGSAEVTCIRRRSGGTLTYTTNSSPLGTSGKWYFFAWVCDTSAGAGQQGNIYIGDLTTPVSEATYATATDSSGAISTEATSDFLIGNRSNFDRNWIGTIAVSGIVKSALTLNQLRALQFRPTVVPNTALFSHYYGTGSQPDWSGNSNSGTVTGPTQASHVPLGLPFEI